MKPIKRKTTNTTFKRPDCYDLPGTRYKYEDETPAIETCWELNVDFSSFLYFFKFNII